MTEYRITRLARYDLEDIYDYTVQEWSLEQAEKYVRGLFSCFEGIADKRIKGKPVDYIRHGHSKVLYAKHYVFYKIASDDVIEIVRVLHVSMDIENRLLEEM